MQDIMTWVPIKILKKCIWSSILLNIYPAFNIEKKLMQNHSWYYWWCTNILGTHIQSPRLSSPCHFTLSVLYLYQLNPSTQHVLVSYTFQFKHSMVHRKFMIKRCSRDEKPPAIRNKDEHMYKSIAELHTLCDASRSHLKRLKKIT